MEFSKKTIILTSNEPWSDIWYSKQHYANELAQIGHQVYFVNSPIHWKLGNLLSWKIKSTKINENLTVIDYKNIFPLKLFSSLFLHLNDLINSYRLKQYLKIKPKETIFWQFDFHRFINLFFLKDLKRIYHVVDPYMHSKLDKKIALDSDLIVCTSGKYVSYYKSLGCGKVINISHGVSNDEFLLDNSEVKRIKEEFGDFAIFVGTLNDDVSFEVLQKIAEKGVSLHILGKKLLTIEKKQKQWDEIKNHSNIYYHGVVPAKNLKNFIASAKVGLVVYDFDLRKIIGSRSPLKILNYIAQEIPVVTSIDSEISELEGKAIYRVYELDNFVEYVGKAIKGKLEVDKNSVEKYLDGVNYAKLIDKILKNVND